MVSQYKSVNIWGVNKNPHLYNSDCEDYLNVINDLGYNSVSIYKKVSNKFLEEAKKRNIKIFSLLPEVLESEEKYLYLTDVNGNNFKQICFTESQRWSDNNIKRMNYGLVDSYIITDIPWYLSLLSENAPKSRRLPPFYNIQTKNYLKNKGLEIPNVIDFRKDWKWWKNEIEGKLFECYMERFIPILEEVKEKGFWFPITVRKDNVENLSSSPFVDNIKKYIEKYNANVILMNATKQIKIIKKIKTDKNLVIGGTEEALGLIDQKNGRKLLNNGYNGFITNEHQLFNNRHPTWKQIKQEMKYLEENYAK